MLRPNYSTFQLENIPLSIIRFSLAERDLSFSFKERVFFFQKKRITILLFKKLFEKRLFVIPRLRPIDCTIDYANT